jgi:MtN3 and saliva related transmembrane protein
MRTLRRRIPLRDGGRAARAETNGSAGRNAVLVHVRAARRARAGGCRRRANSGRGLLVSRLPARAYRQPESFLMPSNTEMVGYVAAFCTTFAFVPQVLLVWRQRHADGISTGMYLIFCTGVLLWFLYGLASVDWPIILANGITFVLAVCVLVMKWLFERSR